MHLTDEEQRMLAGNEGEAVKMAMEMLVALGNIYGAERMEPINSAHVAGLSLKSHGIAGMEWVENLAASGARVRVPTTLNVIGQDRSRPVPFSDDWTTHQLRIGKGYEAMGCFGTSSCVPYYLGFVPRLGQHIAWAESSAIIYVNSVLGARTNREGGPSALAAALTGRTPFYGLHLPENRYGQVRYHVDTEIHDLTDFGALGAYIGKQVGTQIPVITGIARIPSKEELVYFGAALASSGGVAMFHMVGIWHGL
jgi:predicted aconitase